MKIVSYIRVNLGQADFQDELATLFDSISPRLKREVVDYIFETCCRTNKFLDLNWEFAKALTLDINIMMVKPEDVLI